MIGHELLHVPSACVLVFDDKNRVLLMRHADGGYWSFPGGMVEPYESPTDAAVREAWEETGLQVEITGVVGVFGGPIFAGSYDNGDKISYVLLAFRAEPIGGKLAPDGGEAIDAQYFSEEQMATIHCGEIVRPVLDVAFQQLGDTYFQPPTWSPKGDA